MDKQRNLLTGFMADKPKGGRGKKAPYDTKQMRVPQPIAVQIEELCDRYQEFIAAGGDPANPPFFLEKACVAPAARQKQAATAGDIRLKKPQNPPDAAEQRQTQTAGDRHSTERTSPKPAETKPTK